MSGKAIGVSMNYGFPGTYARTPDDIVTSRQLAAASEAVPFGACLMVSDDNTYSAVDSTFTAAKFGGIALRTVKQAISYAQQDETAYNPGDMVNALNRGAVAVVCRNGTPSAGGAVYVRIKENAAIADGVLGGLEAVADGANSILVPNMQWTNGYIDANGVAEITILTRANA